MRGIELPAGTENRKYSDGFYVANSAVFTTDNPGRDWDMFTAYLTVQVNAVFPKLCIKPHYEETENGRKAYILAENDRLKLIVDGQEEYIAVFLTAEDHMQEFVFNTCLDSLKRILLFGYKGFVYRRINYRRLELVEDEAEA